MVKDNGARGDSESIQKWAEKPRKRIYILSDTKFTHMRGECFGQAVSKHLIAHEYLGKTRVEVEGDKKSGGNKEVDHKVVRLAGTEST